MAVARYALAVNRRFKKQGETEADFINCIAFGKQGEFAEKYLTNGMQVIVCGRIQVRNWEDKDGNKRTSTEVVVDEHYFTDSKKDREKTISQAANEKKQAKGTEGFYLLDDDVEDEDLPF